MSRDEPKICIIGAGPTGLGAAWRLHELDHRSWMILEASDAPGGLASSVLDDRGFTWDLGGHVLFSHYDYFDRLMDELLPNGWIEHVRESWVWMRERFIPYPLQNNIRHLPPAELLSCLEGLLAVHGQGESELRPRNFSDWIVRSFGRGLADLFMLPYNRKVWAYDPSELGTDWMGDRVATVDLARVLRNMVFQQDDTGWGPNSLFRFPLRGGTGAIWRALWERLPAGRVRLNTRVVKVIAADRTVELSDGTTFRYDYLVSTMPLNRLLGVLTDEPALTNEKDHFKYSSSHIVGIGVNGTAPEVLTTKCWIYFPEAEVPFYRVTVFSNYSPYNVPEPGHQWSLMCEVSESPWKPVGSSSVVDNVTEGLRRARLLSCHSEVASRWYRRLEQGYPTPFLGRDMMLARVDPRLRKLGIWSRGRFGAWKYEVSNQDHSLMQGVEAVNHILFGSEETTYHFPEKVNGRKRETRAPAQVR